jgi:hypothetical protein
LPFDGLFLLSNIFNKGTDMSEMLQEFVDSEGHKLRVDRAAGVIHGVKLLGLRSRNGRRYREGALVEAANLYEGAKVNVNHPKGHPLSPRDYQDRIGVISGVRFQAGDGLFGDLHFNPKHALSEQLMWDAEHASQNVGLSHNVLARTARAGDETVVEAITKVQSVDLVADPATSRGLFEQADASAIGSEGGQSAVAVSWDSLTIEHLQLHRPDLVRELDRARAAQLEEAQGQLDQIAARDAAIKRRERIVELLQEHDLPLPNGRHDVARQITSEHFVQTLIGAADEDTLRRLVEERALLVRSANEWAGNVRRKNSRPLSRDQITVARGGSGSPALNSKQFAAAITGP